MDHGSVPEEFITEKTRPFVGSRYINNNNSSPHKYKSNPYYYYNNNNNNNKHANSFSSLHQNKYYNKFSKRSDTHEYFSDARQLIKSSPRGRGRGRGNPSAYTSRPPKTLSFKRKFWNHSSPDRPPHVSWERPPHVSWENRKRSGSFSHKPQENETKGSRYTTTVNDTFHYHAPSYRASKPSYEELPHVYNDDRRGKPNKRYHSSSYHHHQHHHSSRNRHAYDDDTRRVSYRRSGRTSSRPRSNESSVERQEYSSKPFEHFDYGRRPKRRHHKISLKDCIIQMKDISPLLSNFAESDTDDIQSWTFNLDQCPSLFKLVSSHVKKRKLIKPGCAIRTRKNSVCSSEVSSINTLSSSLVVADCFDSHSNNVATAQRIHENKVRSLEENLNFQISPSISSSSGGYSNGSPPKYHQPCLTPSKDSVDLNSIEEHCMSDESEVFPPEIAKVQRNLNSSVNYNGHFNQRLPTSPVTPFNEISYLSGLPSHVSDKNHEISPSLARNGNKKVSEEIITDFNGVDPRESSTNVSSVLKDLKRSRWDQTDTNEGIISEKNHEKESRATPVVLNNKKEILLEPHENGVEECKENDKSLCKQNNDHTFLIKEDNIICKEKYIHDVLPNKLPNTNCPVVQKITKEVLVTKDDQVLSDIEPTKGDMLTIQGETTRTTEDIFDKAAKTVLHGNSKENERTKLMEVNLNCDCQMNFVWITCFIT